ncbi:MAG: excinuclease ABC subunit UvrA [Limisphaerales bacterium]|jgi:excinuclease ABC subunit A|nr:excinuclease ABC subunit UvrA [Verrucomicrobiota bacterium]
MASFIKVSGARQHNLKNISLDIPRDQLVVITGPSGSGKSSLAFDTLYAEGQRRYVESLSTYARQFLDQMEKPDVDFIEGLSPAIAIEQRSAAGSPRSTIATATEIYDYLRLLFAHAGTPHSPESGRPITHQTSDEIVNTLMQWPERSRLILLAPVVSGEKGEFRDVLERLQREGFIRVRIDQEIKEISAAQKAKLNPREKHDIEVVIDRIILETDSRTRLADSIETALQWGKGRVLVLYSLPQPSAKKANPQEWQEALYSTLPFNPDTCQTYEPIEPRHFSFNSPQGACKVCLGLGRKLVFSPELVVNPEKTLEAGAILPWRRMGKRMITYYKALLKGAAAHYEQPLDQPWKDLPSSFQQVLLFGSGSEEVPFTLWTRGKKSVIKNPFEGIIPSLTRIYKDTESESTRSRLKGFMVSEWCDTCRGARLRPEVLAITLPLSSKIKFSSKPVSYLPKVPGISIMDICGMTVQDAYLYFKNLKLDKTKEKIAAELLREIIQRLSFLLNVGLGYLSLSRESGTLSGGESQRIRLASQIGAGLVGVLYILDEPSIGLHQHDNERLLKTLEHLRDQGNSVIVVEHDEETIRRANHLIDIGPEAGVKGGYIVAQGNIREVLKNKKSLTGRYLSGDLKISSPKRRAAPEANSGWLEVLGASENNLKNINARFPVSLFTCVTGLSGSGKSTLVDDILRKQLLRDWYGAKEAPGKCREIRGTEHFQKIVVVDQEPIGRTPRSNPATYTGMFDDIRTLFSKLPASKVRGFKKGRFSFNVRGGRCEKCKGDGSICIEMHFLPPVYVTCKSCGGKRYNRETLEITYRGKNIAEILELSVDEGVDFFKAIPSIHNVCLTLSNVGLGYLILGQSATTLSGGEAQRIKLAAELSRKSTGRTLYILDEPTTGLHFHDVNRLLETLFKLRNAGNTLIVIEHNLDVIKCADWIIDLGPEGGANGGEIVVEGPPEVVAEHPQSFTGAYLKKALTSSRQ